MNEAPEGVAAPLEPTRQWLSDELDRRGIPDSAKEKMLGPNDIAVELLEAYAAAVSKNLQEERQYEEIRLMDADIMAVTNCDKLRIARGTRKLWKDRAESAEKKVVELEKEIAALREKP